MQISNLNKGLVLHHPLEQEYYNSNTKRFTDKSAYGNHGTSFNAGINFCGDRMGQSNRATTFNGSSDYIDCGNDSSLQITSTFSTSTWIKSTSSTKILGKNNITNTHGWGIDIVDGKFVFGIRDGANYWYQNGHSTINDGIFHELVAIYLGDGSTPALYVDNVLQSLTDILTAGDALNGFADSGESMTIGRSRLLSSSYNFYSGSIADVRIYNRALSTTEISLLYESYRPKLIL